MSKNNHDKVVTLSKIKMACQSCSLYQLCLPLGLHGEDLDRLEHIIKRSHPALKKNESPFHQGDRFHAIYAIRSGSVKTYTVADDGSEQITGFYLPGELVGLDAISEDCHPCTAKALETTSYCEIPFNLLEELSGELPSLRHQLLKIMSKEITHDANLLMLLGKKTADERLASLLLSLSARFKNRGFSETEFNLSMSRNDIANYLGLAVETVSRLFTRFQDHGLIRVEGKFVQILKLDDLKASISECSRHNPKMA
jgi:CRP/FNR family transcriptional regulator